MSGFERDLARWETGQLGFSDLEDRHPDRDVPGIIELRRRLSILATESTPDPEPDWAVLRSRLEEGSTPGAALRWGLRRRVTLGFAAAMLTFASIGYGANMGPIRRGVDDLVGAVTSVFGSDQAPQTPVTPGGGLDVGEPEPPVDEESPEANFDQPEDVDPEDVDPEGQESTDAEVPDDSESAPPDSDSVEPQPDEDGEATPAPTED